MAEAMNGEDSDERSVGMAFRQTISRKVHKGRRLKRVSRGVKTLARINSSSSHLC